MYTEYAKDPRVRLNLGIRRRFAPLMDNSRRKMELLYSLLLTLPGSPVLYYGDEIGMGDNIYVGDRNGVRTPLQWSGDRNAGFSRADPSSLYQPINLDPIYNFQAVNVEAQLRSHSSLLNMLKDRNAQFENIARLKKRDLKRGLSVVSIDTKKKELLGEFYRDGVIDAQETIAVNVYDFGSAGSGVVIPHGIYDVGLNRGYVHLNTSHDTSELACDSLCPSLTPGGPPPRRRSGRGAAVDPLGLRSLAPESGGTLLTHYRRGLRERALARGHGLAVVAGAVRGGLGARARGDARGQKREVRACYLGPLLRHLDKEIP
jgi:hypothetical protein